MALATIQDIRIERAIVLRFNEYLEPVSQTDAASIIIKLKVTDAGKIYIELSAYENLWLKTIDPQTGQRKEIILYHHGGAKDVTNELTLSTVTLNRCVNGGGSVRLSVKPGFVLNKVWSAEGYIVPDSMTD
jgi:hypothetical protein